MDPEKPWHLQKTPEEWQHVLQDALKTHRANPQDTDLLDVIGIANRALNEYEKPQITAGEHTMANGFGNPLEAVKGEAEGALGAVAAPFVLANTAYRQGAPAAIDQIIEGLKAIPGQITGGDPREIGKVAGGTAAGIAMGRGGSAAMRGTGSMIKNFAEMPGLKNAKLRAEIHGEGLSSILKEIAAEQSGTKGDILGKRSQLMDSQINDAPVKSDILGQRLIHAQTATEALQDMIDQRKAAAPFKQSILEANDYTTRNKAYQPTWPEPVPVTEDPGPTPATVRPTIEPAGPQNAASRALKAALDKLRGNGE